MLEIFSIVAAEYDDSSHLIHRLSISTTGYQDGKCYRCSQNIIFFFRLLVWEALENIYWTCQTSSQKKAYKHVFGIILHKSCLYKDPTALVVDDSVDPLAGKELIVLTKLHLYRHAKE